MFGYSTDWHSSVDECCAEGDNDVQTVWEVEQMGKAGVAASAASHSERAPRQDRIQRQSVADEVEKIEKVVRFGAFWCILMRATSDKMSEIGACLLP